MKTALALLLFTAASAAAQPQTCTSATGRSLTVTGSATLRLPPDRVSFSIGVETLAASASDAFKANNTKLNAVLAALKARGVEAKEIQTSNLEITTQETEGRKVNAFRVANVVTVTREDPAKVSDLLQAAVTAGANQASGLRFFVADPTRLQNRGLELAFQDARAKAQVLADLSKRPLGEVVCVTESPSWQMDGLQNNYSRGKLAEQSLSVEMGTQQLGFSVTVVFELK